MGRLPIRSARMANNGIVTRATTIPIITALSPVDQVLLGHANSLLALDFEKPVRLKEAQQRLNEQALGLILTGEANLEPAWAQLLGRLAPDGLLVDGTCDELGRRCCWVLLDVDGPISLTLACDPFDIERPSDLAERLPKILIHRNIDGQPIHALLTAADRAWASAAGHGVFGPRVRWRAMLEQLRAEGFAVDPPRRRLRDGVLSVPWATVAAHG